MKKSSAFARIVLFLILSAPFAGRGQKHYDFNERCRQAYLEIVQMRLDAGQHILNEEKRLDPNNLIPCFLENYIDFFTLFFNEDPAEYRARIDHLDQRLDLMDEGPESSPFHLFTKSIIHFQWAAIKIKFGNNWDAGWEFRRSFLQSKENQQLFPGFTPSVMLSGAMQVVAGTIPDGYKWLSGLLGIRGNITRGMQQLDRFLVQTDDWAVLYHREAVFYYLYLKFFVENKREEVFDYIRVQKLDLRENYLYAYLAANLAVNDQQSGYAQRVIQQRSTAKGYLEMPVWDLELGYARLNHLEPDAAQYLERFLQNFRGRFYVKDALQKLSWFYYLRGDMQRAAAYRKRVLNEGAADADADKQALKEARDNIWPDRTLLKARLLSDGGYYEEALASLKGFSQANFSIPAERCEFIYRLGRIYDGLDRPDEAIAAYQGTISQGSGLKEYYAARAALQAGYLYERRGDRATAIRYFQQCIGMKEHEYKNSLDQRAKAGIARCSGQ